MTIPAGTQVPCMRHVRASSASILVFVLLFEGNALAADRPTIAAFNVGIQAGLTLVRSAIQRKVRSRHDVFRCLLWGGVSGAGFYGAKELIGSDKFAAGWLVANVAASVSENVAAGWHPVAQIGYSVGPVRFRVPLPKFQPDSDAHVYYDVSAFQVITLLWAMADHDRMRLKGGMLAFERDAPYPGRKQGEDPNTQSFVAGRTAGMFPGVWTGIQELGFLDVVWRHEAVHAVQSLQFDAVEPSFAFLTNEAEATPGVKKRLIRFEHVKLGIVNLTDDAIEAGADNPWREIEAYTLTAEPRP